MSKIFCSYLNKLQLKLYQTILKVDKFWKIWNRSILKTLLLIFLNNQKMFVFSFDYPDILIDWTKGRGKLDLIVTINSSLKNTKKRLKCWGWYFFCYKILVDINYLHFQAIIQCADFYKLPSYFLSSLKVSQLPKWLKFSPTIFISQ